MLSTARSALNIVTVQGTFYEAEVVTVDTDQKKLGLRFPQHAGLSEHDFKLAYETLIVAVGSCSNTFGIKVLFHTSNIPLGSR